MKTHKTIINKCADCGTTKTLAWKTLCDDCYCKLSLDEMNWFNQVMKSQGLCIYAAI